MSYNRRSFLQTSLMLTAGAGICANQPVKKAAPTHNADNRLVLLGTQGGPFIRSFKQTPSANLLVYKKQPFIIDTGFGVTFKLIEAGIGLSAIKYIFITHHHSDHNLELGPLLYNAWIAGLSQPVHVYAPTGLKALLDAYWESNRIDIETRTKDEDRPDIRSLVLAHEYSEGEIFTEGDIKVSAIKNIHPPMDESYALKFHLGEKSVVFSGDTAYCPALIPFSTGALYLIHEVMYGPGVDEMIKRRPKNAAKLRASILSHHTLAEDVGKIAAAAKVQNLVLNHFVPPDDKTMTEQVWIDTVKKTYAGNIIVGKDLLQLAL